MDLSQQAEEYFSSINSIASRLCTDINQTKASYEDYWNKLDPDEQKQILNESIIKPEAQLKYQYNDMNEINEKVEYSVKMIVDENSSYRDEHSAPFSFKTKSQRDLTIFSDSNKINHKSSKLNKKVFTKKESTEKKMNTLNQDESLVQNTVSTLPKTGLDFLDNW